MVSRQETPTGLKSGLKKRRPKKAPNLQKSAFFGLWRGTGPQHKVARVNSWARLVFFRPNSKVTTHWFGWGGRHGAPPRYSRYRLLRARRGKDRALKTTLLPGGAYTRGTTEYRTHLGPVRSGPKNKLIGSYYVLLHMNCTCMGYTPLRPHALSVDRTRKGHRGVLTYRAGFANVVSPTLSRDLTTASPPAIHLHPSPPWWMW